MSDDTFTSYADVNSWELSDSLWERIEPLLPKPKSCYRGRGRRRKAGLLEYDELKGIVWKWQAADGAMTKAPLGGQKTGPNPTDRGKTGTKRSVLVNAQGLPLGMVVSGANTPDGRLLESTLGAGPIERPDSA